MPPSASRLLPLLATVLAGGLAGCGHSPPDTAGAGTPGGGAGTRFAIGVYEPFQGTSGVAMDRYIAEVGWRPAFAWAPMTWENKYGSFRPFNAGILDQYRTRGIFPGLTWEPSKGPGQTAGPNQPDFNWAQIVSGRYDGYITQFATAAAGYGHPFMIRVLHEMDGTWYPWGYRVNGNTDIATFVAAYRHIVDLFRKAGATNVQFVWNTTVFTSKQSQNYGNLLKQAYPGDSYVDWVSIDGYNATVSQWRSLATIFKPAYDLVTSFSKRKVIFFEVGSLENPNDPMGKADWMTQGFLTDIPKDFPKLAVAVWFNSKDGKGRDFAIETSANATNAWRKIVSSKIWQARVPAP